MKEGRGKWVAWAENIVAMVEDVAFGPGRRGRRPLRNRAEKRLKNTPLSRMEDSDNSFYALLVA